MLLSSSSIITSSLTSSLVVSILVGIYLILFYLQYGRRRSFPLLQGKTLVRVPSYPLIGNLFELLTTRIIHTIYHVYMQYGGICELFLLGQRCLFIADIEVAQEICTKRPKSFQRSQVIQMFNRLMGYRGGLFSAEGTAWGPLRRFVSPSFNKQNLHNSMFSIWKFANDWATGLKQHDHTVFDFRQAAFMYTTMTITKVAFGLKKEDDQYFNSEQFITDVQTTLSFAAESAYFPFPRWIWKLSPKYQFEVAGLAANERIATACQKMIDKTRQHMLTHPDEKSYTILSSLLRKESEGGLSTDMESDQIIIANVKLFYVAGTDTTAVVMSWFPYYLTKYPDIAEKVREEADAFYRKNGNMQYCDGTELQELTYCEAFLNEILRLGSPASTLLLGSAGEVVTLQCGLVIQPTDRVFVNLDAMNLDATVFVEPENFDPNRWLTEDKVQLLKMEKTLATFGHGPRICPGMAVALMEAKFALVSLVHHFTIQLDCPHEDIKRVMTFTSSVNKMPIILTPRTVV